MNGRFLKRSTESEQRTIVEAAYSYPDRDEMLIHILEPSGSKIPPAVISALLIEEIFNIGDQPLYEIESETRALSWTRLWKWPICPFNMPLPPHSYRDQMREWVLKLQTGRDYVQPALNNYVTFKDFASNGVYAFERSVNREELKLTFYRLKLSDPSRKWEKYYSRRLIGYKWWTRELQGIIDYFDVPYIGKEK